MSKYLAVLALLLVFGFTQWPAAAKPSHQEHNHSTGVCGESMSTWHPPVVNGCATGHEHGSQPPEWLTSRGVTPQFSMNHNTSGVENSPASMNGKHPAMKGFATQFTTAQGITRLYFRIHSASNAKDRSARYHSYDSWWLDPSNNLSYIGGWYDTGDPRPAAEGGARFVRRAGSNPSQRPIILAVDETSLQQGIGCEQWYERPGGGFTPDFGWTICGATQFYRANENLDTNTPLPGTVRSGEFGLTRRLEIAYYANRSSQRGTFTSDQFGQQIGSCVNGKVMNPAPGISYTTICVQQTVQPTLPAITFDTVTSAGRNSVQQTFPSTGLVFGN